MKDIILVIACEFQTIGEVKKQKRSKKKKMKLDWIVLDFWQWVGEAQGLDWWWPSGRGDVHRPRREDLSGVASRGQKSRGRGRVTKEKTRDPHRGPAQGFPRAWPDWEARHIPSTQGLPAQTEPGYQGAFLLLPPAKANLEVTAHMAGIQHEGHRDIPCWQRATARGQDLPGAPTCSCLPQARDPS